MSLSDIESGETVFIDANIFIYEFSGHDDYGEPCLEFLERVEETDIVGVTSVGVLDEVVYKSMLIELSDTEDISISEASVELRDNPSKIEKLSTSVSNVEEIFDMPILVLGVTGEVFEESLGNVQDYNLRPHDAVLVQLMDFYGIDVLATNDDDFSNIDWINVFQP